MDSTKHGKLTAWFYFYLHFAFLGCDIDRLVVTEHLSVLVIPNLDEGGFSWRRLHLRLVVRAAGVSVVRNVEYDFSHVRYYLRYRETSFRNIVNRDWRGQGI